MKRSAFSKIGFSLLLIMMQVMISCNGDGSEATSAAIRFVSVEDSKETTRATQVTSIPSFGMSCSVYSSSATYSTAALGNFFFNKEIVNNTDTEYIWPGSGKKCSFYGYYPYGNSYVSLKSTTSSTGKPEYSLSVPADISQQVDFCVAEVTDMAGNYNSTVTLPFKHVCSSISFKVKNTGVETITLKSISFYGVKLSGTYKDGTWTLSGSASTSSSNTMTISPNKTIAGGGTLDVSGTSDNIIIIPQTISSGVEIFDVLATVNGADKHFTYSLPGAVAWEKGVKYTYTISISNDMSVDLSTIEDWEGSVFNGTNDIYIDNWN